MIHLTTSNRSFIEMSEELKGLGIRNHEFMLELKDPSLADIDVFSLKAGDPIMPKIYAECRSNPWYFLRECIKILTVVGGHSVRFELNRATTAMIYNYINGISTSVNTPRQTYITNSAVAIIIWSFLFGGEPYDCRIDGDKLIHYMSFPECIVPVGNPLITKSYNPENGSKLSIRKSYTSSMGLFSTKTISAVAIMDDARTSDLYGKSHAARWWDLFYDMGIEEYKQHVSDVSTDSTAYITYSAAELRKEFEWHFNMFRAMNNIASKVNSEIFLKH